MMFLNSTKRSILTEGNISQNVQGLPPLICHFLYLRCFRYCTWLSVLALSFPYLVYILVDLDPLDNLNEEEFEEQFHVEPADDPEEELKREEALVENENMIKEVNEEFLDGKITWYDEVNSFDNLPKV